MNSNITHYHVPCTTMSRHDGKETNQLVSRLVAPEQPEEAEYVNPNEKR